MGIFFPRIGGRAAFVGFCCGILSVFLTKSFTDASFLLYGFIGLIVSVSSGLVLSFFFKDRKDLRGLTWMTP